MLRSAIREHGFGVYEIDAVYPENARTPEEKWVIERSFLVVGKNRDDHGAMKGFLRKYGAKYDQDVVLRKAHNELEAKLAGISDCEDVWLKPREERSAGNYHPNRAGEFHWMPRIRDKPLYACAGIVRVSPSGFFGHFAKYVVEQNSARPAAAAETAEKRAKKSFDVQPPTPYALYCRPASDKSTQSHCNNPSGNEGAGSSVVTSAFASISFTSSSSLPPDSSSSPFKSKSGFPSST